MLVKFPALIVNRFIVLNPTFNYNSVISRQLFKEYLKLLNRLYDITWFG